MNEPITLEPKRTSHKSVWLSYPQRDGFTQFMADQMRVLVPIDMGEAAARSFVQRVHLLSAIESVRTAKKSYGLMHANEVSN